MDAPEVARAVDAALSIVSAQGLPAEDASVVWNSNKLSLRIDPCAVFARVALVGREVAALEIELAECLAQVDAPVGVLDPRVEPRVHERDGFAITLWTFHDSQPADLAPAAYAAALHRLHVGMRQVSVPTPHFTDRVTEAEELLSSRELTPDLGDTNRTLLADTLAEVRRAIGQSGSTEQLLHGEPHPPVRRGRRSTRSPADSPAGSARPVDECAALLWTDGDRCAPPTDDRRAGDRRARHRR